MATEFLPRTALNELNVPAISKPGLLGLVRSVLMPLASLKLTVVLFAMAIFIVLAGTLAQVEDDIWVVIRDYFRTPIAWIKFQIFFPPSFFPDMPKIPGGFYFPGGWLIGTIMAINLLAAHTVRFTFQAKGLRLFSGIGVLLVGAAMTWVVIISGDNASGILPENQQLYDQLWLCLKVSVYASFVLLFASLFWVPLSKPVTWGLLATGLAISIAGIIWLLFPGNSETPSPSSMRILWQLTKGGLAGGCLLAGCLLAFGQRAGIVLLHGGIALLMLSEVLVGTRAVEAQMSLSEGQTQNFVQDVRTVELAISNPLNDKSESVTVIPSNVLLGEPWGWKRYLPGFLGGGSTGGALDETLTDPALPFGIRIHKFYNNAQIVDPKSFATNPATAGHGLKIGAIAAETSKGTDAGGKVDMPAAYIELFKNDGTSLGTYLVSALLAESGEIDSVDIDGKKYQLALRFERHYKPYSVTLKDVRRELYIGTSTPKDFSSDLHIYDPARHVDRDVKVWMNNPLRFAGDTLYQTGYHQSPQSGAEFSTISVVANQGWMIPYVSCMIVAIGMLAQFMITLLRFLNRIQKPEPAAMSIAEISDDPRRRPAKRPVVEDEPKPKTWGVWGWIPAGVAVLVFGGYIAGQSMPRSTPFTEFDLASFGELPVVSQGRTKPFDTLARTSLQVLSGKSTYADANDKSQPAIRWLLDIMAQPRVGGDHRVLRIENFELLALLGLERRPGFRYSPMEVADKLPELARQADLAREKPATELTAFEKKLLQFERQIGQLDLLTAAFGLPRIGQENPANDLREAIRRQQALEVRHPPLAVPPAADEDKWQTFASAWTMGIIRSVLSREEQDSQALSYLVTIYSSWAANKPQEFNKAVADYREWLATQNLKDVSLTKLRFEAYFNRVDWFTQAAVVYLAGFVLAMLSWLFWQKPLGRAALALLILGVIVHTLALAGRMYISGRPPVTNLYSSAVFIGWASVLLGILLEAIYRNGIGNVIGATAGYATLLIAWGLAADGDTFDVLQAVLDTQFWLATHVTCITLGYATTYIAGLLGLIYLVRGVLTPSLTPNMHRELYRMTYGVLCFSIFFSFVGTVLGGLWADDSWGRFWGWDPKENGALMIVLWNALALHARWGGLVKERGLAVLAVMGNIVVSWSWFGVNELGVGLHSYGFKEGTLFWLGLFVLSQLVVVMLGLVPKGFWWSARRHPELLSYYDR
ncbi:cytochrome c assembly protein [Planctopirus limnophila DSM 3776]|uniref:Cytochrome c assembly protein n=1 Tax=Planctopirus limnophila (strain ATCC 43296 / DSM 3776 / IFAM 1008 / Mu 290) TaxID=521674 RepID=D5SMF6_PLAL2|nr:cytochrome c biogenesis protein CcsA [Planctopirus limnophila]ADG65876.1 cytochrome c assembly protein [Planctopirus limnophila DSM 3776]